MPVESARAAGISSTRDWACLASCFHIHQMSAERTFSGPTPRARGIQAAPGIPAQSHPSGTQPREPGKRRTRLSSEPPCPSRIGSSQRTTASLSPIASRLATVSPDFVHTLTSSEQRKLAGHDRAFLNGGPPVHLSAAGTFSYSAECKIKLSSVHRQCQSPQQTSAFPQLLLAQPAEFFPHTRQANAPPPH